MPVKHLITIERHFLNQQVKHAEITPDLTNILYDINLAAKVIRKEVIRAGLSEHADGLAGTTNIHGEDVKKLDVFANECVKQFIGAQGRFAVMASEEEETIIIPTQSNGNSQYVLLFDPLDGSSNIDVNVSVGTIFSIYKMKPGEASIEDCLQKGDNQVAAGYVIYGSSVVMVYTAGFGVHGFTYDPTLGEFFLSHPDIQIPNTPTYYSINEGNAPHFFTGTQEFLNYAKGSHPDNTVPMSGRYIGSLVTDFHRNLLKGGIYIYPGTKKSPKGKLRLIYEANPLAFICEQAGGHATDGQHRILDIIPTELHQRTPLYIGTESLVKIATAMASRNKSSTVAKYQT